MSGIGSSELIILVLIGLIVLGPKRLPQIANQLGSWIGQARRMTRAMKRQLEDELNFDDDFNPKPPRIAPPPVATNIPDPPTQRMTTTTSRRRTFLTRTTRTHRFTATRTGTRPRLTRLKQRKTREHCCREQG